jgi:hypothetical protein
MDEYSKLILPKNLPTSPTEKQVILTEVESQVAKLEIDKLVEQKKLDLLANKYILSETAAILRGVLNGFHQKDQSLLNEINRSLKNLQDRDNFEESMREWFRHLIRKT